MSIILHVAVLRRAVPTLSAGIMEESNNFRISQQVERES